MLLVLQGVSPIAKRLSTVPSLLVALRLHGGSCHGGQEEYGHRDRQAGGDLHLRVVQPGLRPQLERASLNVSIICAPAAPVANCSAMHAVPQPAVSCTSYQNFEAERPVSEHLCVCGDITEPAGAPLSAGGRQLHRGVSESHRDHHM